MTALLPDLLEQHRLVIDAYFKKRAQEFAPGELTRAVCYALEGSGKRVRPAVVLMVGEALGHLPPLEVAASVECFHIASLIADDLPCMDDADARRARPSLHKVYGQATALLTTYALIAEGYGALRDSPLAVSIAAHNAGIQGLTGGQCEDLRSGPMSVAQLEHLIWMKTGSLFEMAFLFGWIYGHGDVNQLDTVRDLSRHYALAFQIADDIEDIVEDAQTRTHINYALTCGLPAAQQRLVEEVEQYRQLLHHLQISTDGLRSLVELF